MDHSEAQDSDWLTYHLCHHPSCWNRNVPQLWSKVSTLEPWFSKFPVHQNNLESLFKNGHSRAPVPKILLHHCYLSVCLHPSLAKPVYQLSTCELGLQLLPLIYVAPASMAFLLCFDCSVLCSICLDLEIHAGENCPYILSISP